MFTSKELDRETGMYYFGARYQDPKLGIFISVDPLAEEYAGVSSYTYALNNPVRFTDPNGRSPLDIVFFNMQGQEIHRIESKTEFRAYVSSSSGMLYPGASPFGTFAEARMPNIIQYKINYDGSFNSTTSSQYQKYDYQIAADVYIFNTNKNNNIVPTLGGEMMSDASRKVPDLNPTDVKSMIMLETAMGAGGRTDIMQANVYYNALSHDWNNNKLQFGLVKGGGATAEQSIKAGIGLLFLKGLRDPNDLNHNQTDTWFGGNSWGNAIRDYNGSSKDRTIYNYTTAQKNWYKAFVTQMTNDSKTQN